MQKALDKNSIEYKFMRDFWGFIQEWYIPENSQKWWDGFHTAYNKLAEEYADSEFCIDMLYGFVSHQDSSGHPAYWVEGKYGGYHCSFCNTSCSISAEDYDYRGGKIRYERSSHCPGCGKKMNYT